MKKSEETKNAGFAILKSEFSSFHLLKLTTGFLFSLFLLGNGLLARVAQNQILLIDDGVRSAALGGSVSGKAETLEDFPFNPAALGRIHSHSFRFSYSARGLGMSLISGALGISLARGGTIALSYTGLFSGTLTRTSIDSSGTIKEGDSFSSLTSVVRLGWGLGVGRFISFGLGSSWVREDFSDASSSSFLFDLGTVLSFLKNRLGIGLSVRHLGFPRKIKAVTYSVPTELRAGITGTFGSLKNHRLDISVDGYKTTGRKISFSSGLEYTLAEILSFRLGYDIGKDTGNFSSGLGIKIGKLQSPMEFAYALVPMGDLGLAHRAGFSMLIGRPREKKKTKPLPLVPKKTTPPPLPVSETQPEKEKPGIKEEEPVIIPQTEKELTSPRPQETWPELSFTNAKQAPKQVEKIRNLLDEWMRTYAEQEETNSQSPGDREPSRE